MADTKIYTGKAGIQELWRRIKAEIGKFTSFQKAEPSVDGTPDVALEDRKTNIIYLVPVSGSQDPDHYNEWIWTEPESAEPEWVCIGDTTTDVPEYETATGTVSGTTLTVDLTINRYTKFTVANTITDIVVNVPADGPDKVGWFRFEFTLPEDTSLEHVSVLDSTGSECLMFAPMSWTGLVTYQGEVTDKIAKIIGYSPVIPEENILCTDTGANIVTGDRKKLRYRIVED